ncbi:MAG: 50S ribosomal protein L17 [Verrucomicrobia bacterium]|nr:MAG: 50S ribosomal protein L17 [Verrucomicrobiota bacterium]
MRHRSSKSKLKRTAAHRRSLLANLACSLIEHGRIKTTLGKAKALRPVAEKMVTLGKSGDLHARRQAIAFLRQKDVVQKLFAEVAPAAASRPGGYCRITKLGARMTDAAPIRGRCDRRSVSITDSIILQRPIAQDAVGLFCVDLADKAPRHRAGRSHQKSQIRPSNRGVFRNQLVILGQKRWLPRSVQTPEE